MGPRKAHTPLGLTRPWGCKRQKRSLEASVPPASWGSPPLFSRMTGRNLPHDPPRPLGHLSPCNALQGSPPFSFLPSPPAPRSLEPAVACPSAGLEPPSPPRLTGSRPLTAHWPSKSSPALGNSVPVRLSGLFSSPPSWCRLLARCRALCHPSAPPGPVQPLGASKSSPRPRAATSVRTRCPGFARGWPPIQLAIGQQPPASGQLALDPPTAIPSQVLATGVPRASPPRRSPPCPLRD